MLSATSEILRKEGFLALRQGKTRSKIGEEKCYELYLPQSVLKGRQLYRCLFAVLQMSAEDLEDLQFEA